MKLNDLNKTRGTHAKQALKEHFGAKINLSKLTLNETSSNLKKIRNLISEMKLTKAAHSTERSEKFMKLVFMEQMLAEHQLTLQKSRSRVIIENQEVERSQVLLAAQDMVDTLQKMIENVSDMLVKELPAVSDRASSEIGENEGQQFTLQASEGLGSLQASLIQTKTMMQSAVSALTGQGMATGSQFSPDSLGEPDMSAQAAPQQGAQPAPIGRETR